MSAIAVVGLACRYPDAASPRELWENVIAGRRAFRRLPDERMRLADYWDADRSVPDRFYARNAAVIEGYEFDRMKFRIAGSTYRSTDLTHWLALDVAASALGDAGFPMGEDLPRERTGVVVGNTLTGEFSRANVLRLRWPYVRRTVGAALREQGWDDAQLADFLGALEQRYKAPFPEIDEDTLAGGLSNTIAGRICNYFDLKGGGYTVDGACSSSLLSVLTACRGLADGELDVAVAGGVDLSIDPFEIIGFAKTGALARGEMKVYDRGSNGFWPGEGCGMVVLMRHEDAVAQGRRIYASIAGWGVSSDGKGGITRPEEDGYRLALRRAYDRAGFGVETVAMFEGHGTGTEVGDATELRALTEARRAAGASGTPAAISSIKAMIGHTKAAAGVAGLLKAVLAVHHQMLPPTVGCEDPHDVLTADGAKLRVLPTAEPWPADAPLHAGITAMGFGGINTHLVLQGEEGARRSPDARTRTMAARTQNVELLALDADTPAELAERIGVLAGQVVKLSYAQLGDLAAGLYRELGDRPYRAAVVARSPEDAERQLLRVHAALQAGETRLYAADGRAFLGHARGSARVGFLFPGQGTGRGRPAQALRRRFTQADRIVTQAALPTGDVVATEVAQPRIVTGSVAGLSVLSALGIEADVAVGHSLGELTALHWAGAMDLPSVLRMAATRGRTMAEHGRPDGAMAGIPADPETVRRLLGDDPVVIGGYNSQRQTVVSGPVDAVGRVLERAEAAGVAGKRLRVSHAFHSPLVAEAAEAFGGYLSGERFHPLDRQVISTVTGAELPADTDLAVLLRNQITDPVLFAQAVALAAKEVDLFVEVGPGRILSDLARTDVTVPAVALDTDDETMASVLRVVAAAYVVGAARVHPQLFDGRLVRPLKDVDEFTFFTSPCETVPEVALPEARQRAVEADAAAGATPSGEPAALVLRRLVAERAELPLDMVGEDSRLLDDLHLSSITVSQVVNQAAQRLGVPPSRLPTNVATATVREVAEALDTLVGTGLTEDLAQPESVAGVATFIRAFAVDLVETPAPTPAPAGPAGSWQLFGALTDPRAEQVRQALATGGVGGGVLVWLPADCTPEQLEPALQGARAVLAGGAGDRFVVVQHGLGASGLARTLRLEDPRVRTTVVHLPTGLDAAERVLAEVAATEGYHEVHYDPSGGRREQVLRALPITPGRTEDPLTAGDVLLVTGGGKGITAECALALAADAGAKLAVLGRSELAGDAELTANLERFAAAGVEARYFRADVTDPEAVRAAVDEAQRLLGPVTAVLHGAGRNEPAALTSLDMDAFHGALAPKVGGLTAVLAAVDADRLKLLVTFGSIIGRAGLRGEAHYATANDRLAEQTRRFGAEHPHCRALCLEWSVWSGVGMGERLSVVESLTRDGITPITPDQGVAVLRRLVGDPQTPPVVVVSGRADGLDTLRFEEPELPLLRFVDRPQVRYHGVELVTDVELTAGSDLYLPDHLLDGNLLFPAVFGMEAMAQVAMAVTGREQVPVIEQARFARPIVVPPHGSTTIRIAALVTADDTVRAVIRTADTGFAADHFEAQLRFVEAPVPAGPPEQVADDLPPVPLDPARDLYGDTLFQGARFQRLRGFHRAAARDVDADVATMPDTDWFSAYLSRTLVLGDPGVRDALMHGNQVCVPDATLLPVAIERLYPAGPRMGADGELRYCATERERDGDTYVYDIALRTGTGEVVERWEGLHLRAVRKKDGRGPWVAPLLGSYLERTLGDLIGAAVAVAVEPDGDADAGDPDALAVGRALGHAVSLRRDPDGRPEKVGDRAVAVSHGAGLRLAVAATAQVGCDVRPVPARPAQEWSAVSGRHGALLDQVVGGHGEDRDTAGTRIEAVLACLRQVGLPEDAPVALTPARHDGWLVFASDAVRVATLATTVGDAATPVVLAVLTDGWS
ncbi:type I polyketide synthase [Micromonospora coxensis]|uniref:Enediyne polyketide synthase n=1 Tax=Micromonospora coxensis TaxID=356852 RepID=A0A1C5HCT8_9ACTN|nr:type I polyketide synthase [Micromonospora coxensis]SCG43849.1 enediyne polyketide synthase [Micromonospora coxensis]